MDGVQKGSSSIQKVSDDLRCEYAKYDSDNTTFPQHILDEAAKVARFASATALEAHLVNSLAKAEDPTRKTQCTFYFTAFGTVTQAEVLPQRWDAGKALVRASALSAVPLG